MVTQVYRGKNRLGHIEYGVTDVACPIAVKVTSVLRGPADLFVRPHCNTFALWLCQLSRTQSKEGVTVHRSCGVRLPGSKLAGTSLEDQIPTAKCSDMSNLILTSRFRCLRMLMKKISGRVQPQDSNSVSLQTTCLAIPLHSIAASFDCLWLCGLSTTGSD